LINPARTMRALLVSDLIALLMTAKILSPIFDAGQKRSRKAKGESDLAHSRLSRFIFQS
jgi:hypothetical protein